MGIFPITRKGKDQQALAQANQTGGAVTIKSRNKIANPNNPGQTLGRGSQVIVKKSPTMSVASPVSTPGKVSVGVEHKTSSNFVPGDFQNKRHDRSTSVALGRSMGEDPAKTHARMDAQAGGKTSYTTASGKKEYAGRIEHTSTPHLKTESTGPGGSPGKSTLKANSSTTVIASNPQSAKNRGGHAGIALQRSAGENSQGHPQNYMSLNHVNKQGEKKTILKMKTFTPGTKGRTGSQAMKRHY